MKSDSRLHLQGIDLNLKLMSCMMSVLVYMSYVMLLLVYILFLLLLMNSYVHFM